MAFVKRDALRGSHETTPKSLFEYVLRKYINGRRVRIDFRKKDIRVGTKLVVQSGTAQMEENLAFIDDVDFFYVKQLVGLSDQTSITILEILEELFSMVHTSSPLLGDTRSYFSMLDRDDLSDMQLALGKERRTCVLVMELFLFCVMGSGYTWKSVLNETSNFKGSDSWFWRSQRYPQFVMLKDWFEGWDRASTEDFSEPDTRNSEGPSYTQLFGIGRVK